MNVIELRFEMRFKLPKRMNSNDRKAMVRMVGAAEVLTSIIDKKITADRHHFRDAADAMESLANIAKRAAAVSA